MSKDPISYAKLVGTRGSLVGRYSLWLGPDHVLLVEANLISERYQRVWLRDVQGFFVRSSRQARWSTGVGLGLLVMFGFLGAVLDGGESTFFMVLGALAIPLLINGLFFARTHHFYAVTAVQRAEWPNVARDRHVRKVLGRLEPLIRAAQAGGEAGGAGVSGKV